MVRFKNRWLLLGIDDRSIAARSPFPDPLATYNDAVSKPPNVAASLSAQLITRLLRASLLLNFGDVAAGAYGGALACRYYSPHTGTAIVRCSREAARHVWAAATLISSPVETSNSASALAHSSHANTLEPASLRVRVVHCGGTIKKVQTKAIELDRKTIINLRQRQLRHAAASKAAHARRTTNTPPVLSEPAPTVVASFGVPADEDEDLGEALAETSEQPTDTIQPSMQSAAPQSQSRAKPQHTKNKHDAETAALLADSEKQIKSIDR
ncbi:hypothetical protein BCV70DRAFT_217975 [Testicularia cyperi]|uniref:Uncharacterized protein n=1 Tax=Testicularia cyperi TaxID=1882483 RepID=A0A317XL06_9BASI|nr:hypothetical protein BCV70DRAFT_217975 [Testicularia cyperi]